jgi:ribosomal protein S1
LKDKS